MDIGNYTTGSKGKELLFSNAKQNARQSPEDNDSLKVNEKPWKVMIIDDEDIVHQVSLMVLDDYKFKGRSLETIHGYSGGACRKLMEKHPDTAVLLLDVVMETDSAGLDSVQYIRDVLDNHTVKIVIRTGQPGLVSEDAVKENYKIYDYLEKSDLTAQKLYGCITSALTAYGDDLDQE